MQHPARKLSYDELYLQLQQAVSLGMVKENHGADGLVLYCYTDQTVYERNWNETTMMARGLILDVLAKTVVATPFPKFFNYEEVPSLSPSIQATIAIRDFTSLPFEVFEKLDGSLIIIFYHNGEWKTATKGSLSSDQAKWAKAWLDTQDTKMLSPGITYLAEAIYPENKIVVNYGDQASLILLGAYNEFGLELPNVTLVGYAVDLGWKIAQRYHYYNIEELLESAKTISCNEEGWVVRSTSGQRLKIKGSEYCRVHRMISNLTPLSIWRALRDQEDLELFRKTLPEEFWSDFDTIYNLLVGKLNDLLGRVLLQADELEQLTDKEVGLQLHDFPTDIRSFIFPYRKHKEQILAHARSRQGLFEVIRPTRNQLAGYRASSLVHRVQESAE